MWKQPAMVQFITKEGNEKFAFRWNPTNVKQEWWKACGFVVFFTPLCGFTIYNKIMVMKEKWGEGRCQYPLWSCAETESTTKLLRQRCVRQADKGGKLPHGRQGAVQQR